MATLQSAPTTTPATRQLKYLSHGHRQGPITRLMSPGDLGEVVKPFVFLDYFEADSIGGRGFPAHPHSGLATHTTLLSGATDYGDSTGKSGVLDVGSVEWMQAGRGVWHWGNPRSGGPVRGYQLWVALPAALEHAPPASHYIAANQIASDGRARVLLGTHGGLASPIPYTESLTYLHVMLADGERYSYEPAAGHDVAWLAVHRGALHTSGKRLAEVMAVFEDGTGAIELVADGETEFVIGSAVRHPHPLVCGSYSVHTSRRALMIGEAGIDALASTPLVVDAIRRTRDPSRA